MVLRHRQADEDSGEHREDVGLNEGNQTLQAVQEDGEDDRQWSHDAVDDWADVGGDEDNANECQEGGVTCHDVGKETNHQCHWLGEDAEELDDRHDGLQPTGNVGPENFFPILLVGAQVDKQERASG